MGRYGGIDTDGFTRSLLGGAAIGQRTISLAQDQQALLERLRQQQLREQTDQNTARYLQTIFSGGQMPQGFDAGTVDPQAIQTGAQWGDEIANRQAENDFYNGIFTGQPMQANPRVSPQSLRFGMEYRQDQADSRGMADQYAMARGEGPGMVGPQSPDVQSAYGMSAQSLAPMVRETLEQRAKRESAELQKQALSEALRALDAAALTPGRFTPSQYEGARRQLIDRMNGLELPQSLYAGPPQQGQQSMTPEELAQSIMYMQPGIDPKTALNQARAAMNFSRLEGGTADMLMDPGGQAREFQEKVLTHNMKVAEEKVSQARAAYARAGSNPVYKDRMVALKDAGDLIKTAETAYNTAETSLRQFYEQQAQPAASPSAAPAGGNPSPSVLPGQNAPDAMDAAFAANPPQPHEVGPDGMPTDAYFARIEAMLQGTQR